MNRIGALLLMGGEGTRFGSSTPKQFLILAGKPVYLHTLQVFLSSNFFQEIILVCPATWVDKVKEETKEFPQVSVIAGGQTRQESSKKGLLALKNRVDIVVIHDGVRPFVTEEILKNNISGAIQWGAVDTCIPSADTLVHIEGTRIHDIPNRAHFLRGQTPQSFRLDWILDAHKKAENKGTTATDDCRLVLDSGRAVHTILGDEANIKITTELDLFLAEQLFRLRHHTISPHLPKNHLKGKLFALVGGGGGIGSAIARRLVEEGAETISLSRSEKHYLDLSKPESISDSFHRLHEEFGPLDGLINCAGKFVVKPLEEMSLNEIEEILKVNLEGLILCCRFAKLKKGAHVINMASSSFTRGRSGQGVYSSAKAGVVNFTQAFAEERTDLKVWTVVPQRTNTNMRRKQFPQEDPSTLLDPEEISKQIIAILHDDKSTGQLLEIRR